jgi:hypothetical protein
MKTNGHSYKDFLDLGDIFWWHSRKMMKKEALFMPSSLHSHCQVHIYLLFLLLFILSLIFGSNVGHVLKTSGSPQIFIITPGLLSHPASWTQKLSGSQPLCCEPVIVGLVCVNLIAPLLIYIHDIGAAVLETLINLMLLRFVPNNSKPSH